MEGERQKLTHSRTHVPTHRGGMDNSLQVLYETLVSPMTGQNSYQNAILTREHTL